MRLTVIDYTGDPVEHIGITYDPLAIQYELHALNALVPVPATRR